MAPPRKGEAEQDLLEQYSSLIDRVAQEPYDRELHLEHIRLTTELKDVAGLDSARDMMATYHPLTDSQYDV
jgi:hypothetical protein